MGGGFGKILEQWETGNIPASKPNSATVSATKNNAVADGGASTKVDALTAYLRINGVFDKDAAAEEEPLNSARCSAARRKRLLRAPPDVELDLHGKNAGEALGLLETFFDMAHRRGLEKVRIVHGKGKHSAGGPVLDKVCRDFLERCPYAGERGNSGNRDGGSGATWVLLK
jgi:DNA-nicking Smr family endonuclease